MQTFLTEIMFKFLYRMLNIIVFSIRLQLNQFHSSKQLKHVTESFASACHCKQQLRRIHVLCGYYGHDGRLRFLLF